MLTFRRKYKKLKQTEVDQSVLECLGHFHMTRSQAFACAKMASAPKKLRQTLPSGVFLFKGQHKLKAVNTFFESAFEDLSLHSFLKASD